MTVPRQQTSNSHGPQSSKPRPVNDSQYAVMMAAASAAAIALLARTIPHFKAQPPDAQAWQRFVVAEFLLISAGRRTARVAQIGHYQWAIDQTVAALGSEAGALAGHVPPGAPDVGWLAPAGPRVGPLFYDFNATQALLNRVVKLNLNTSGVDELITMGSGGIDYHVGQAARETNLQLVGADEHAIGWVRILGQRQNHCAFCITLASRGPVYKSKQTADFHAHDNCGCQAIPAFTTAWWPNKAYSTDWAKSVYDQGSLYTGEDSPPARNPSIQNLRRWLDANPLPATRPLREAV